MFISARMKDNGCAVIVRHTDIGLINEAYRSELCIMKDDGSLAQRTFVDVSTYDIDDDPELRFKSDCTAMDRYGVDLSTMTYLNQN